MANNISRGELTKETRDTLTDIFYKLSFTSEVFLEIGHQMKAGGGFVELPAEAVHGLAIHLQGIKNQVSCILSDLR